MANPNQSIHSGEPGSTGRELFEGSTATGPGEKQPTYGTGYKEGTEAGDKGNHGEHDHDLGAGPHKRGASGSNHHSGGLTGGTGSGLTSGGNHGATHGATTTGSSGLTGGATSGLASGDHSHTSNTHSHSTSGAGVTGGHSGSGTGDLSGRPADISSALKVPHEEHALHGAGIQSIGGAAIGGNHNPRSIAAGTQGRSHRDEGNVVQGSHAGHGSSAAGQVSSSHNQATGQGVNQGSQDTGRHGLTNQFDHSDDKLLAGVRKEADLPTDGRINKESLNPDNLLNRAGDKANQKADQKANENGMQGGGNLEDKARQAANQSNH